MIDQRVEQTLVTIARQHAPQALQQWDRRGDIGERVPRLARLLANYNILVIMGDFPQTLQSVAQDASKQIQGWVDGYGQFYLKLANTLFPSFRQIGAHYTDDRWPVIIYLRGAATPVIQVMAGYISPYIVQRQLEKLVSEVELLGLMEYILEELEATTLPREVYKKLLSEGTVVLKQMLTMPIRQLMLTNFDRLIFSDSQRFTPLPTIPPPEPPTVPEEDSALLLLGDSQPTRVDVQSLPPARAAYNSPLGADTETLNNTQAADRPSNVPGLLPEEAQGPNPSGRFGASVPVFFNRSRGKKQHPPVPPLPNRPRGSDDQKPPDKK